MSKIAILTDSNSGITQAEAKELGVYVIPMPFYINDEKFLEDITLAQDQFYERLVEGADIKTSTPAPADVTDCWDELLKEHDAIIMIPMSSGLSSTMQMSKMLASEDEYEGKVWVVDNQRISVTQRQAALDAKALADAGKTPQEIHDILMANAMESSIYIMVDTLTYLKKGGRITPAAAALGTLLKLKPVLQIQGEKLDAFAKARTVKLAKSIMIKQVLEDAANRYGVSEPGKLHISMAYTPGTEDKTAAIEEFKKEVQATFPGHDIVVNPLSLSVSCHIGPGALAVTATKAIEI
ncbi:MAG: DegV family protein [Eubacterium sp.]|nr:DegV family protein [Eubacterium sp.]